MAHPVVIMCIFGSLLVTLTHQVPSHYPSDDISTPVRGLLLTQICLFISQIFAHLLSNAKLLVTRFLRSESV